MKNYKCTVCNYIYNESKENKEFSKLSDNWACPVCGSSIEVFVPLGESKEITAKEKSTVSDILVQQMS